MGVPLVDLVTNLKRMDLDIVNEERFLKFTVDMAPLTPNQPALYNYLKAVYLLILQEQFAISTKRSKDARNNIGGDFGRLADLEDKMFRQKFVQEPVSPWLRSVNAENDSKEETKVKESEKVTEIPQQQENSAREASDENATSQQDNSVQENKDTKQ